MKRCGGAVCRLMMLALAVHLNGQVRVGDLSADLTANLTGGYTGDYGNLIPSDHSFTGAGTADLTGFYHDPNFLSFDIVPYYNQSRAISGYQSISDASGVNASTSIFAGSRFPGSIGYSKSFNSEGNFGFPDLPNYTTHGDTSIFNVGWGAYLPNLPTLSASYSQGDSEYSLYGATGESLSHFQSFTLNSTYNLEGFSLNGGYRYLSEHYSLPELFNGEPPSNTRSATESYNFGVGHSLPFNGGISASASRSDSDAVYASGHYNTTIDTLFGSIYFIPIHGLSVGANVQYLDNLTGSLYQSLLAAGAVVPETPQESSHSLDVVGYGNYTVDRLHMTFSTSDDHRNQVVFGQSFESDALTGTTTYANSLWGGFVTATAGVVRTSIDPGKLTTLGFIGSGNYSRQINRWTLLLTGHYDQNAQTVLIEYQIASYSYSASVGHKIGRRSHVNFSAGASKSEIINQSGSGSYTQSYSANYTTRYFGANGSYTRASGTSILTSNGLVPTPIPVTAITPSSVILYGGNAYAAAVSATPTRGMSLSASYSKAFSNTQGDTTASNNRNEVIAAFMTYKFRKVLFNAGYTKLNQSFSGSGGPPSMTATYFIGLSRWFNFF